LGFPHPVAEPDIETLIAQGESATLEFKSTARWNVVDNKKDKTMEQVILKTVAGMLNSEQGGVLLIGVEDSGTICGLDPDYQTWKTPEKRNCDQYELWLTGDLLFRELGRQFSLFIKTSFHSVQGKDVCKLTVLPASMPAYLSEKREGRTIDVFYLRTGNQTILVDSMSEFAAYYQKRWGGIA
jgi:predicted HTH transcriptional regulator